MEPPVGHNADENVIDIVSGGIDSRSTAHGCNIPNESPNEDRPSTTAHVPASQSSSAPQISYNPRNVSSSRGDDNYGQRHRGSSNSGLWILIQFIINLSQIIASVVVLFLSRPEQRLAPLGAWVIGYAFGCVGTLPHLYWRHIQCNHRAPGQDATNSFQNLSQNNVPGSNPFTVVSVIRADEENVQGSGRPLQHGQNSANTSQRINLNALVDCLKMALDCFLVLWLLIGYFMLLGGRASASDAPNLYRLFIALLTFSFIWCAMPYILCAMRCCCLPCLTKRGTSAESINSLATCKFKVKRIRNADGSEIDAEVTSRGVLIYEADKERTISAEDAVCCICIANYADNDDLRELPCNHLFHMTCVDEWLKINALCPLCKAQVR